LLEDVEGRKLSAVVVRVVAVDIALLEVGELGPQAQGLVDVDEQVPVQPKRLVEDLAGGSVLRGEFVDVGGLSMLAA
jgi:hypothetical protein